MSEPRREQRTPATASARWPGFPGKGHGRGRHGPAERVAARSGDRAATSRCPRGTTRPLPTPRGFTLIEAIAAFVLLALFLGVLMSSLSVSMRNTIRAEQESLAAQWAQSKLDLVGIGEKLEEGSTRGEFDDDFRWEMNVEEYIAEREVESEIPFDLDSLGMRLYRVDLDVIWGDRDNARRARFTTLRAYSPDQAVLFNQLDGAADAASASGRSGTAGQARSGNSRPVQGGNDGTARK